MNRERQFEYSSYKPFQMPEGLFGTRDRAATVSRFGTWCYTFPDFSHGVSNFCMLGGKLVENSGHFVNSSISIDCVLLQLLQKFWISIGLGIRFPPAFLAIFRVLSIEPLSWHVNLDLL